MTPDSSDHRGLSLANSATAAAEAAELVAQGEPSLGSRHVVKRVVFEVLIGEFLEARQ